MIFELHYITQDIPGKTHVQLAEEACAAGVNWVQLRMKNTPYPQWRETALATLAICRKYDAKLIINDNVQLALEIGADGVHVGKEDMSAAEARRILGDKFIIGGTANTFEDIKTHFKAGVNYVGLGPYRFTTTKEKLSPVLGLAGYTEIIKKCKQENIHIPVIAIGGVQINDVPQLMQTGVYGVAVASVIAHSDNKLFTVKELLKALKAKTKLYDRP